MVYQKYFLPISWISGEINSGDHTSWIFITNVIDKILLTVATSSLIRSSESTSDQWMCPVRIHVILTTVWEQKPTEEHIKKRFTKM